MSVACMEVGIRVCLPNSDNAGFLLFQLFVYILYT